MYDMKKILKMNLKKKDFFYFDPCSKWITESMSQILTTQPYYLFYKI
jgi:hypothetical protein